MTAVSLKKILTDANKNNYAVAGLVVLAWDDALAFTKAADETGVPIILQAGPSCRAHTPVPILGKMFRYLAAQTKTHVCCHIDHGYTFRECAEGIDSGFTSVMFDGSKLSLKENIKKTTKIVKRAHDAKVSVEGEIGFVGYANGKSSEGTLPSKAVTFAKESNVDAMAVSVGNTHLQTDKIAKIDLEKIKEIQNSISTPLVLHGGSGIPNLIRKKLARETNIAKFNIGTELRMIFGNALRKQVKNNPLVYDRLQLLKPTMPEITKNTKKIIKNFGPR
ncbi:class II fructose-bisphosphate aldolase [Alphaproteobacteria bacterium]|nr:class II fructose-bisphosphate aldolase [Alphaproteobacteria bacterium]